MDGWGMKGWKGLALAGAWRRHRVWLVLFCASLLLLSGCAMPGSIRTGEMEETDSTGSSVSVEGEAPESSESLVASRAEALLASMSLKEKLAQMMVVSLEGMAELGEEQEAFLSNYGFGGVVLRAENFTSPEQAVRLVYSLHSRGASSATGVLPFVAYQEGGTSSSIWTCFSGSLLLGATGDPKAAIEEGNLIGRELGSAGLDAVFGPSCTVVSDASSPAVLSSFGGDAQMVASMVGGMVRGIRNTGIMAALQYLPQEGQEELVPLAEGIQAGAEMLLLEAEPSQDFLQKTLREELGFTGLILSDSFQAGADLFLMPVDLGAGAESLEGYLAELVALVENGEISEEQLDTSVKRILSLKEERGLLSGLSMDVDTQIRKAQRTVGSDAHLKKEWEIIQKGITLVKGEEILPLSLKDGEKALVMHFAGDSQEEATTDAMGRLSEEAITDAVGRLSEEGILSGSSVDSLGYDASMAVADVLEATEGYAQVVVLTDVSDLSELDPEAPGGKGFQMRVVKELSDYLQGLNRPLVVVSTGLPVDVAAFAPLSDAVLCAYGSGGDARSVMAALCAVFGEFTPQGSLPVPVMRLSARYQYTDAVLYEPQWKGGSEQ